ncbi:MAG: DoxX family protein, partial [Pseudomonadota bacterium]
FLVGFAAKVIDGWLWSDAFLDHLNARLLDPPALTAFQQSFLTQFAIPHYFPLGWVVTLGELPIALGLLFSVHIRFFAICAVAMMIGFAAGGYVDISTLFLMAFAIAMAIYPLKARHPLTL